MTPDERKQLIDSLIEGEITDADFLRIEAELSVDPEARREYYDRMALTVLLEVEAGVSGSMPIEVATPPSVRRWRRAFVGMAAAAVVLLAVVGWLLRSNRSGAGASAPSLASGSARVEEQAAGFAIISGQKGAVWKDQPPLSDGALVPTGRLHLASGIVQLELFSGVTVVVEGEAEFTLISPMEMTVARGKVRAHVPEPAHGFRIRTGGRRGRRPGNRLRRRCLERTIRGPRPVGRGGMASRQARHEAHGEGRSRPLVRERQGCRPPGQREVLRRPLGVAEAIGGRTAGPARGVAADPATRCGAIRDSSPSTRWGPSRMEVGGCSIGPPRVRRPWVKGPSWPPPDRRIAGASPTAPWISARRGAGCA